MPTFTNNLQAQAAYGTPQEVYIAPLPFQELAMAGAAKQKQFDVAEQGLMDLEDSILKVNALTPDINRRKQKLEEIDAKVKNIYDRSGGDLGAMSSEVKRLAKDVKKDLLYGEFGAMEKNYQTFINYKKDLDDRLKKEPDKGGLTQEHYNLLLTDAYKRYEAQEGIGELDPTTNTYRSLETTTPAAHVDINSKALALAKEMDPQIIAKSSGWYKSSDGERWLKEGSKTENLPKEVIEATILPLMRSDESTMSYLNQITDLEKKYKYKTDPTSGDLILDEKDGTKVYLDSYLVSPEARLREAAAKVGVLKQKNNLLEINQDMKFDENYTAGYAHRLQNSQALGEWTGPASKIEYKFDDINQIQDIVSNNMKDIQNLRNKLPDAKTDYERNSIKQSIAFKEAESRDMLAYRQEAVEKYINKVKDPVLKEALKKSRFEYQDFNAEHADRFIEGLRNPDGTMSKITNDNPFNLTQTQFEELNRLYKGIKNQANNDIKNRPLSKTVDFVELPKASAATLYNTIKAGSVTFMNEEGIINDPDDAEAIKADFEVHGISKVPINGSTGNVVSITTPDGKIYNVILTANSRSTTNNNVAKDIFENLKVLKNLKQNSTIFDINLSGLTNTEKSQYYTALNLINPNAQAIASQLSNFNTNSGAESVLGSNSEPIGYVRKEIFEGTPRYSIYGVGYGEDKTLKPLKITNDELEAIDLLSKAY